MINRIAFFLTVFCAISAQAQVQPPVTGSQPFVGATTTTPGVQGLVPAPSSANALAGYILNPGGTWTVPMAIQPAKVAAYQVAETDIWTIIPVNCAAPCTITLLQSSANYFPPGSGIEIKNVSSPAVSVTVTAQVSTIYGVTLSAGNVILASTGDHVDLLADSNNNYFADGFIAANSGITQLTGVVTAGPGSGSQATAMANSGVTAGSYTNMSATVGADGRVTSASNGSNVGCTSASTNVAAGPNVFTVKYNTGQLAALPGAAVGVGFEKIPISAVVDNIVLSTQAYTCSVAPTVSLRRCGTSTTCAASTSRGAGNPGTTAGTTAIVAVTDGAVPQGDYLAWMFTAGTCTVMNLEATAFLHSNPGFCIANSQMAFTTQCNSAMMSLI